MSSCCKPTDKSVIKYVQTRVEALEPLIAKEHGYTTTISFDSPPVNNYYLVSEDGDIYWKAQPEGAVEWGEIAGNIEHQYDLIDYIRNKIVQYPGDEQEYIMSQRATTELIFANPAIREHIKIGNDNATQIEIGKGAQGIIAIGEEARSNFLAIGKDIYRSEKIAIGEEIEQAGLIAIGTRITDSGLIAIGNEIRNRGNISIGNEIDSVGDIAIGRGVQIGGSGSVASISIAIGNNARVQDEGLAFGPGAEAVASFSIALGHAAIAYSSYSYNEPHPAIAIGNSARAEENSIAIGYEAYARSQDVLASAIAIGSSANAEENSIAIGRQAQANTHNNSVALGSNSQASEDKVVSVGSGSDDYDKEPQFRRIVNVDTPINNNDAVIKNYLYDFNTFGLAIDGYISGNSPDSFHGQQLYWFSKNNFFRKNERFTFYNYEYNNEGKAIIFDTNHPFVFNDYYPNETIFFKISVDVFITINNGKPNDYSGTLDGGLSLTRTDYQGNFAGEIKEVVAFSSLGQTTNTYYGTLTNFITQPYSGTSQPFGFGIALIKKNPEWGYMGDYNYSGTINSFLIERI